MKKCVDRGKAEANAWLTRGRALGANFIPRMRRPEIKLKHSPIPGSTVAFGWAFIMPERRCIVPKLTAKQQRFVDEYLIDLNATQAAIRAGYSHSTATEQASRLLANVKVSCAVATAIAERSRRTGVNADQVVRELARVAFVDPTQIIDFNTAKLQDNISADDRAVLAGVKVKSSDKGTEYEIKIADKIRALELLGKHVGLFEKGGAENEKSFVDAFLQATSPTQEAIDALYHGEAEL